MKDQIKRLKVVMSDLKIDGKDPTLVFDFLYRFVTEANMLRMRRLSWLYPIPCQGLPCNSIEP